MGAPGAPTSPANGTTPAGSQPAESMLPKTTKPYIIDWPVPFDDFIRQRSFQAWLTIDAPGDPVLLDARISRARYHWEMGEIWGRTEVLLTVQDQMCPDECEPTDYPQQVVEPPLAQQLLEAGRRWGAHLAQMELLDAEVEEARREFAGLRV